MSLIHEVLIVGAGLSGLAAARGLQAAGRGVLVLDKGRGVGGRAATRRWDGVPVDHGAQFFTARSPEFRAQVADWQARGVCFEWARGFHQFDGGRLRAPDAGDSHPRYACRAGMSALGKDLAAGLTVQTQARVTRLHRGSDGWRVETEAGDAFSARRLVLALPVPQALALLDARHLRDALDPAASAQLEAVETAPTLAVLLRGPAPAPEWQGIQLRDETLSWIAHDTDKRPPAASDAPRVFVLHAAPAFSREWQDDDPEAAADRIVARAGEIVGAWITRLPERQVHRWRFASVPRGSEDSAYCCAIADKAAPLYLTGDAFCHAKVEGAFLSGQKLAHDLLAKMP